MDHRLSYPRHEKILLADTREKGIFNKTSSNHKEDVAHASGKHDKQNMVKVMHMSTSSMAKIKIQFNIHLFSLWHLFLVTIVLKHMKIEVKWVRHI